jgi:hypothetical protein
MPGEQFNAPMPLLMVYVAAANRVGQGPSGGGLEFGAALRSDPSALYWAKLLTRDPEEGSI